MSTSSYDISSRLPQAAQSAAETIQETAAKTRQTSQRWGGRVRDALCRFRQWTQRYPPLSLFLVMLMTTSAVPLGTFATVALLSLGALLTVSLTIVGFLQGGVLAVGGTMLSVVLGGCALFSLLVAGGITAAYVAYNIARYVLNFFWRSRGVPSYATVAKGAAYTAKQAVTEPIKAAQSFFESSGGGESATQQAKEEYRRPPTTPITSVA